MAKETIITNFTLKGREILSSYAAYTIEGVMTAKVKRGRESYDNRGKKRHCQRYIRW